MLVSPGRCALLAAAQLPRAGRRLAPAALADVRENANAKARQEKRGKRRGRQLVSHRGFDGSDTDSDSGSGPGDAGADRPRATCNIRCGRVASRDGTRAPQLTTLTYLSGRLGGKNGQLARSSLRDRRRRGRMSPGGY